MSKITKVSETKIVDGVESTFQNIRIVQIINNMSRGSKIMIGIYTGIVFTNFVTSIYKDGKRGLLEYRVRVNENGHRAGFTDYKTESDAIWNNLNGTEHFFRSLFFPWSFITNIAPLVIIKMNPPGPPGPPKTS